MSLESQCKFTSLSLVLPLLFVPAATKPLSLCSPLKLGFFFFFLVSGYEIPLFFPVITCALPLGVLIGFDYYYYYYYYFCLYLFWVLFWLNFCYYANFFFLAFKNINNIIEGAKFNFIETNC